jgi:hypothetical protein
MPERILDQVLNLEDVLSTLQDSVFAIDRHRQEHTAQIIVQEGRKVFAILLDIGCEHHLPFFIEEGLLTVPIQRSQLTQGLSEIEIQKFESAQSEYLVHTFRKGVWMRRIPSSTRLPYVDQKHIGGGGYSTVWSVSIYSPSQDFIPDAQGQVRPKLACLVVSTGF